MSGVSVVAAGGAAFVGASSSPWRTGTAMGPTGSGANDSSEEKTPLICGLPDDIAIICLARVPRTYHADLKCVSKRWRELVCGEEWRIIRKKYNLEETWIYALCQEGYGNGEIPKNCCYVLDPYAPTRNWKRIQDIPPCIVQRQSMSFEVLGQKAYLIGGRDFTEIEWSNSNHYSDDDDDDEDGHIPKNIADEVHCYDAITNSWSKAAPLSTPRCPFASEVLDGKIYAVGSRLNPDAKHTWESYDPISNIWTTQSDHHPMNNFDVSIVYNGKLYVNGATYGSSASVYDPLTGIWQDADKELVLGWRGASVVADGRLYACDLFLDFELRTWEEDRKEWIHVANLRSGLVKRCRFGFDHLAAIGKSMFFVRKGLCTIEFDFSNFDKDRELPFVSDLMTGPVSEVIPLICKCMTI